MYSTLSAPEYLINNHTITSKILKRKVDFDIFLPDNLLGNEMLNLLLLNDGQDAEALGLQDILTTLYSECRIHPVVVVCIKTGAERIQEYGVANNPDFKGRGSKASAYTKFIITELMPFIDSLALNVNGKRGFAGFSLGGLSAFDIVLHNP
ncbi:MAG: esterase family protein, partial [Pedobacter sp.]